jgi:hypothetical protein
MKHFILIATASAIVICCQSTASAQGGGILREFAREFGGQLLEQQMGRQQRRPGPSFNQPPQDGQFSSRSAMPGESGRSSGGDQRGFNPELGFVLPGNGLQPARPQPGFIVQPQPRPIVRPQPTFTNPNNFDGRTIYIEGQPQPSRPFFTQPSQSFLSQSTNSRSVTSSNDMPSAPVMSNQFVLIRCPAETMESIRYTLSSDQGNFSFTLSGGQEQRFRVNRPWSISYASGSQQMRHALQGGTTYSIRRTPEGKWQLFSTNQSRN